MTSKTRRQRGSRTHGGGSHKNRRGAGHRGGRGNAGRDKHEFHNQEPLGKKGFQPVNQSDFAEINIQQIDEDIALYVADGLAQETNSGFRIDVREIVDTRADMDGVKVLGSGRVRNELEVIADEFTQPAIEIIQSAGGDIAYPDEATKLKTQRKNNDSMDKNKNDPFEDAKGRIEQGEPLNPREIREILDRGIESDQLETSYDVILSGVKNVGELDAEHVVELYRLRNTVDEDIDISELDAEIDNYFGEELLNNRVDELQQGVGEDMSPDDIVDGLEVLENEWQELLGDSYDPRDDGLPDAKKNYLLSVREAVY